MIVYTGLKETKWYLFLLGLQLPLCGRVCDGHVTECESRHLHVQHALCLQVSLQASTTLFWVQCDTEIHITSNLSLIVLRHIQYTLPAFKTCPFSPFSLLSTAFSIRQSCHSSWWWIRYHYTPLTLLTDSMATVVVKATRSIFRASIHLVVVAFGFRSAS